MTAKAAPTRPFSHFLAAVPAAGDAADWDALAALAPALGALDACPQDPVHHAEGDVGRHTRLVLSALLEDAAFQAMASAPRSALFWAAALHDVGKPATTRRDADGRFGARGHSRLGAQMARRLFWEAGAPIAWREAVCAIILRHQAPFWLIEREDPRRLAITLAEELAAPSQKLAAPSQELAAPSQELAAPSQELAAPSQELAAPEEAGVLDAAALCRHARADGRGRIAADQTALLERITLAEALLEEEGLLSRPWPFANDESRVAYFEREDRDPGYAAHAAPRCRVTLMAGLPGAGKDSWAATHRPDRPVVSLDAIRRRLGAPPTGAQGAVIEAARDAAREHLRAGRDFVWNATNLTRTLRAKPIRLFRDYGAAVEIVYVEVGPDRQRRRNRSKDRQDRNAVVPEAAVARMLDVFEPPNRTEAHRVLWVAAEASPQTT